MNMTTEHADALAQRRRSHADLEEEIHELAKERVALVDRLVHMQHAEKAQPEALNVIRVGKLWPLERKLRDLLDARQRIKTPELDPRAGIVPRPVALRLRDLGFPY